MRACRCEPLAVERYRARVSGPLIDRIDIHLPVPAVPPADLSANAPGAEPSAVIRARVDAARQLQRARFAEQPRVYANAHMQARDVRRWCRLDEPAESLLRQAIAKLGLSARAHTRILKVARTIADLAGAPEIDRAHVSEAIQYRLLDRARSPAAASA